MPGNQDFSRCDASLVKEVRSELGSGKAGVKHAELQGDYLNAAENYRNMIPIITVGVISLANPLLPSHPNFTLASFNAFHRDGTELNLPYLQPIITPIASASNQIKRPAVLGTCDARTQHNTKIFYVERCSI